MGYIFFIFLNYAVWSISFPIARYAVAASTPLFLTAGRMFVAGTLLLIYSYYKYRKISIQTRDIWPLLMLGVFGMLHPSRFSQHPNKLKDCFVVALVFQVRFQSTSPPIS